MQDQNDIRVQQAQQEEKPKKTKPVSMKIFMWLVAIGKFGYRVWRFFEGDSES